MPETNFSCTLCGQCCHNHSLPLTLVEAIDWLEDGGNLAVFCEAMPWSDEPSADNLRALHRKKRSFEVICGGSRARVTVILVAVISGACKNLSPDMKCSIYERRPLVCRIYPAEISPFINFDKARKVCPPEAWISDQVLLKDGRALDQRLQHLIEKSIQADRHDAVKKSWLCNDLGIELAAIADEGFVAHEPSRADLLAALKRAQAAPADALPLLSRWRLYSREATTLESLVALGMHLISEKQPLDRFTYLHSPR